MDEVIVSTDDDKIVETVLGFGLSKCRIHHRDATNAGDASSSESVMLEYLTESEYGQDDIFILVQATSPFTKSAHFSEALTRFQNPDIESLLSVVVSKRFYWNIEGTPLNYDFKNRPRRQDHEGIFMENGAFYINVVKRIIDTKNRLSGKVGFYEMPEYTGLELDEPDDWLIAEQLMKRYGY